YGLEGRKTQPASPNENGDVEQSHYRFKKAVSQELMLRNNFDFASRKEYEGFLKTLFKQLNSGRRERLQEECRILRGLPARRLESWERLTVKAGPGSTIRIKHNVYSVPSRLIRKSVEVRLHAEYIELWHGQKRIETMPRLRGEKKHHIQYRHVIDWLVRKPGAFENYRYREALYPASRFRMAYDRLQKHHPKPDKAYLRILKLAAWKNECAVDDALQKLIDRDTRITPEAVEALLEDKPAAPVTDIRVDAIDLNAYDALLHSGGGGQSVSTTVTTNITDGLHKPNQADAIGLNACDALLHNEGDSPCQPQ
ncbi:MAG: hypothetical protein GY862_31170, partial [Gammaproteobacteria bacterium]|nr:hypothetical protein [Gammaproteobacteria bacterium]